MKFDDFDLDSKEEIPSVSLDLDKIRTMIPTYSSEKLSEMIVVERYIGFHPEVSVMAMEELAKRRMEGDPFVFENYIDQSLKSLPKLDFNLLDLRTVMLNAIGNVNSKK